MKDEQKKVTEATEVSEVAKEEATCGKCEEYLAGWKRALADYDNLKKDLARERDTIRGMATESLAYEMIAILDNFDQALKFRPKEVPKDVETWSTGIMHVRAQVEDALKRLGVEPYGSIGEAFDAHLHESVGDRHEEGAADQSVVEVTARGWKMGGRVIRPAKIIMNVLSS